MPGVRLLAHPGRLAVRGAGGRATWWVGGRPEAAIRRLMFRAPLLTIALFVPTGRDAYVEQGSGLSLRQGQWKYIEASNRRRINITAATVFTLIVAAHGARMRAEPQIVHEASFWVTTAIAAALSVWAWRLLWRTSKTGDRKRETLLAAFADAWNRHDVDALMSMMTRDGVFEASSGGNVDGERHAGYDAVRGAYAAVFAQYPDAHWGNARHFVTGDRGVSEWTFTASLTDGKTCRGDRM